NRFYDFRGGTSLGRPAISIGNITTGGTGKTPVVRWLAERCRSVGVHPAVLLRGYRTDGSIHSDEQMMLDQQLNAGSGAMIRVIGHPSRITAARELLVTDPRIDVFILDDAFQHRRAARDFDLVLIDS